MKVQEVINKSAQLNAFPMLISKEHIKYADSNTGTVTVIKPLGIAVRFEGMNYDIWFWEKESNDEKVKSMSQLEFIK